jgi:isoleucyl-tRNA synthetase
VGFPVSDESLIDLALNEDMAAAQRLSSLALSARETAKIKVRQPLARLAIGPSDAAERRGAVRFAELLKAELNVKELDLAEPGTPQPPAPVERVVKPNLKTLGRKLRDRLQPFKEAFPAAAARLGEAWGRGETSFVVEVEGEAVELGREDLLVKEAPARDAAMASDGSTWVSFDTTITEDLRLEGLMRDLLRSLQVQRKESGLQIEDRVAITYSTRSTTVESVIERFGDYLKAELLGLSLEPGDASGGEAYALAGEEVTVRIAKATRPR